MPDIIVNPQGIMHYGSIAFPCVLGRSGVTRAKKEGDGATPIGRFPLRHGYYRSDRLKKPHSMISLTPIGENDGWCDDPALPYHYNTKVQHPFEGSAERMWRDDICYDIVIILGYNDDPPIAGQGSAIFLHVAKPDLSPTEGCVALGFPDLQTLLGEIKPDDHLVVLEPSEA